MAWQIATWQLETAVEGILALLLSPATKISHQLYSVKETDRCSHHILQHPHQLLWQHLHIQSIRRRQK